MQLLACAIIAGMIFFNETSEAQYAFDTGRFIKIDVTNGEVEGKIRISPEKEALSEEQYRLQRIKEVTGKSNAEVKEALALDTSQQHSNEKKVSTAAATPVVSSRPLAAPLMLDYKETLIEKTKDGMSLPRISEDKTLIPWQVYAKPSPATEGKYQLSLVITNLGLNPAITEQAMEMNEYITLAFSPYARDLSAQIKMARASGFETWLNVPLQHENYPVHDYGPLTLLEELSPADNITQLHKLLNNNHGIVGLLALPDEKYSRSAQMGAIFEELHQRGLLLTLYHPFFSPAIGTETVLKARPHIHGGNVPTESGELFRMIEASVMSEKRSIVTIAAMPKLLQEMNQWIASLPAKNIVLVPLSANALTQQKGAE